MKYCFLFLLIYSLKAFAQTPKQFARDASVPELKIYSDHLKPGGSNPKGEPIAVANYYITINFKPALPVTGEFLFSLYANQCREESTSKLQAGKVKVIATNRFWKVHELTVGPSSKIASYLLDLKPYPQSIFDFGKANSFIKSTMYFLLHPTNHS